MHFKIIVDRNFFSQLFAKEAAKKRMKSVGIAFSSQTGQENVLSHRCLNPVAGHVEAEGFV